MKSNRRKTRRSQESKIAESVPVTLAERLRADLKDFIFSTGMEAVVELLEEERTEACGPRYARNPERAASRNGHVRGELVMGGRRVSVRRPRARTVDGSEVRLPSWDGFSQEDPLSERAVEQMVVGVSTRKYHRSLESSPPDIDERGTSKSAVSRRFVAATTAKFRAWMSRDLSALHLVAIMIDGIHFADHVILVALGFDVEGRKHVLGVWEGATENSVACKGLLGNLRDRGVNTERSMLFVIDGAKGLHKAIRSLFGDRALIQRCRVHKRRNVREQLPIELHASVKSAMTEAYKTEDPKRAKQLLENLARRLESEHPSAAGSLREGLDETLTVTSLRLGKLTKIFSTTNPIENLVGTGRNFTRRVKRWRGGSMILRWMSTAMDEAEQNFRRIYGYKEMHRLVRALEHNDQKLGVIDDAQHVA